MDSSCKAKLAEGAFCVDPEHCDAGFCLFGRCSVASGDGDIPDGQACGADEQCLSGICVNSLCSPPLVDQERCADPNHCASLACVQGFCTAGALDHACTPDDACAADLVCVDFKCQAKLEDGAYCANLDERCVSELCVLDSCSSGAADQTCTPDAPCANDLVCIGTRCQAKLENGLYCGTSSDNCVSELCVAGLCSSGALGETCAPDAACEAELVCLNGRCRAKLPEGQYCADAEHCESGFCLFEKCSAASGEGDIPDDDYCEGDEQCLSGICLNSRCSAPLANGLYCASPDHCESASCVLGFCSSGGVGESCTPTDACATEDLVCMDSKCQAKLDDGLSCFGLDERCVSGACVVGVCTSGGDGQTCDPAAACADDLVCINSKCQAKLEDGQYCGEDGGICASALCVTSFCTSGADGQTCDPAAACEAELVCLDGRCRAKLPDGQFCVDAEHCESGFCLFQKCSTASGVGDIPDGDYCEGGDQCLSGICLNSKCSAPLADGLYCYDAAHCESLACVMGFCSSGADGQHCTPDDACATEDLICVDSRCRAKLPEGQYCMDAAHCESGFCLFDKCSSASGVGDIPDGQTCATDDQCLSGICLNAKCSAPLEDGAYCANPDHCVSTSCVQGFCSSIHVLPRTLSASFPSAAPSSGRENTASTLNTANLDSVSLKNARPPPEWGTFPTVRPAPQTTNVFLVFASMPSAPRRLRTVPTAPIQTTACPQPVSKDSVPQAKLASLALPPIHALPRTYFVSITSAIANLRKENTAAMPNTANLDFVSSRSAPWHPEWGTFPTVRLAPPTTNVFRAFVSMPSAPQRS